MEQKVIDEYHKDKRCYLKVECLTHSLCYIQRKDSLGKKIGCVICAKEKQIKGQTKGVEYFIYKSKLIHGDSYLYDKVVYVNSKTPVCIGCKICNEYFMQRPDLHKEGRGCGKCAGNKKKNICTFIEEANYKHNNYYDYSEFLYVNSSTKGIVKCPKHGAFKVTPNSHLCRKTGCKLCANELGGYDYTAFKRKCDKNNNGFGRLYVIRCFDEYEEFYKIGITSCKIERRFHTKRSMPYNYEIIQCLEYDSKTIYDLEKILHYNLRKINYKPSITFDGCTECFMI